MPSKMIFKSDYEYRAFGYDKVHGLLSFLRPKNVKLDTFSILTSKQRCINVKTTPWAYLDTENIYSESEVLCEWIWVDSGDVT